MKKTSLILAFFIGAFTSLHAQDFTFGIKGGLNYNSIGELYHYGPRGGTGVIPSEDTYYTANKEMGYHFGAYVRMNYEYFYIRPEINFTSLKSSYDLALETSNWTQSNIDIPIFFGYKISEPFSVYAGPIISSISDRELEGNETKANTPWDFEKSNIGVGIGLNYQMNRFAIDLRYAYTFTKVEYIEIDMIRRFYGTNRGALLEYNPSQFVISLQIDLFNFGGEKKSSSKGSKWNNHKNL